MAVVKWQTFSMSVGDTSGGFSVGGESNLVVSTPMIINGETYGTVDNAYTYIQCSSSILAGEIYKAYYEGSWWTSGKYKTGNNRLALAGLLPGSYYSFDSDAREYSNSTISGVWRINRNISDFLQGAGLPLKGKIYINNELYFEFTNVQSDRNPPTVPSGRAPKFNTNLNFNNHITNKTIPMSNVIGGTIVFDDGEQDVPIFLKESFKNNMTQIFENIYTIKDLNGLEILGSFDGVPDIKSMTINNNAISFVGTNNEIYITTIKIPEIEHRNFIGLSLKPYTSIPTIPNDNSPHNISINNSTTFYLSYSKPSRPINEPITINLYQSVAESNRVDKTDYLTLVGTIQGVLRDYTSITDLSISVQLETIPQFNYIYIESFNRYYFVSDISSVNKDLWEISANCDVLMSYKDALYNCYAFIDRNENEYNRMIVDNKTPFKQGQNITTDFVENILFKGAGTYVLQGLNLGSKENEE